MLPSLSLLTSLALHCCLCLHFAYPHAASRHHPPARHLKPCHRSKRATAPPTPQALPPDSPWWGSAVKPGVAFPPSGEVMAIPPGCWPPPPLQSTSSFVSPYGAWMGAVPTPDGEDSQNTSNNPLEW
nr:unnamed protein product [Digitaria exilis]